MAMFLESKPFEDEKWSDLTPIEVDPEDSLCAQILYDPLFAETMNYFRAILSKGEKSERALELTGMVIEGNAANYTAWAYRRECLFALGSNLESELEYVTLAALESPKNYQIWFHRRAIVEKLGDGSNELQFVAQILEQDAKNYHAWSHRQFVLQHFNLFDGELEFVTRLIEQDVRNNSAWNQRYFVVSQTTGFSEESIRKRELEYAFAFAKQAPNNESPFNYIRGIMRLDCFTEAQTVQEFAEELRASLQSEHSSGHINEANPPPLLALLVAVYEKTGQVENAVKICGELANKFDTIRVKYWQYKANKIAPSS